MGRGEKVERPRPARTKQGPGCCHRMHSRHQARCLPCPALTIVAPQDPPGARHSHGRLCFITSRTAGSSRSVPRACGSAWRRKRRPGRRLRRRSGPPTCLEEACTTTTVSALLLRSSQPPPSLASQQHPGRLGILSWPRCPFRVAGHPHHHALSTNSALEKLLTQMGPNSPTRAAAGLHRGGAAGFPPPPGGEKDEEGEDREGDLGQAGAAGGRRHGWWDAEVPGR